MDMLHTIILTLICASFPLAAWKIFNFVWFKPKKLEKSLRQQGFTGNSYKVLFGDSKEMGKLSKEAKSKPIDFSADYVPRIMPFIHKTVTEFGTQIRSILS